MSVAIGFPPESRENRGPMSTRSRNSIMSGFGKSTLTKQEKHKQSIEEIQQEMKLLHWHKLANEAALKAALIRTRKLRTVDRSQKRVDSPREVTKWIRQVALDEEMKPLQVDDEFIRQFEEQEKKKEEQLEQEVQRHVRSLKKLKENLRQKEEIRQRNTNFRQQKAELCVVESSLGRSSIPYASNISTVNYGFQEQEKEQDSGVQNTLNKVIHSLNHLMDLEKRISKLEHESTPHSNNPVKFSKSKTRASPEHPSRTVFDVRMNSSNVGARMKKPNRATNSGQFKGTFLTALPESDSQHVQPRKNGVREQHRQMKEEKKMRDKERTTRQDAAIQQWLESRKKKIPARSQLRPSTERSQMRTGGSSQARATRQFREIRQEFEDRKSRMMSQIHNQPRKPAVPRTRTRSTQEKGKDQRAATTSGVPNRTKSNSRASRTASARVQSSNLPSSHGSVSASVMGVQGVQAVEHKRSGHSQKASNREYKANRNKGSLSTDQARNKSLTKPTKSSQSHPTRSTNNSHRMHNARARTSPSPQIQTQSRQSKPFPSLSSATIHLQSRSTKPTLSIPPPLRKSQVREPFSELSAGVSTRKKEKMRQSTAPSVGQDFGVSASFLQPEEPVGAWQ